MITYHEVASVNEFFDLVDVTGEAFYRLNVDSFPLIAERSTEPFPEPRKANRVMKDVIIDLFGEP